MKSSSKGSVKTILIIIIILVLIGFVIYAYSQQGTSQSANTPTATVFTNTNQTPAVPQTPAPKTTQTNVLAPAKVTPSANSSLISVFAPVAGSQFKVAKSGNWTSVQPISIIWATHYAPVKGLFAFLVPSNKTSSSVYFADQLGITASGGSTLTIGGNNLTIPPGSYQIKICDEGNITNPSANPIAGTACGLSPVFSLVAS